MLKIILKKKKISTKNNIKIKMKIISCGNLISLLKKINNSFFD